MLGVLISPNSLILLLDSRKEIRSMGLDEVDSKGAFRPFLVGWHESLASKK